MKDSVTVEVPFEDLESLVYDSHGADDAVITIQMAQLRKMLDESFRNGMKCGVEDYLQEQKWEKEKQNEKTK